MNRKDLIDRLQELYKDEDSRVTINLMQSKRLLLSIRIHILLA